MGPEELLAADRAHVWHPYAPMPAETDALLVESAEATRIRLADGRELIDGMSSWWAAIHGYRHPVLDAALAEQARKMSHVMFGGLTHEPAITLARTLVEITPGELEHVFFADSGSVSVEVAIKMCLQYWRSAGRPEKRRLATWRGGYHGDTFHPMSVCDPEGGMHALWRGVLPEQVFAGAPPPGFDAEPEQSYIDELDALVAEHADELAAVVVEPVVQGAGGMRFHSPGYVAALREITSRHGVLLVADEIATGFGRTGALFAVCHAGVVPDVLCVGKALTGGYLSMGVAMCTPEVARGISGGEVPVLAHGPTFMGNPLSCAVANASIGLLRSGDWERQVETIETGLRGGLAPAREAAGITDVRVLGAIGVLQLDHEVDMAAATRAAARAGVWLRPFRNLVYAMPPYISSETETERICAAMLAAARAG